MSLIRLSGVTALTAGLAMLGAAPVYAADAQAGAATEGTLEEVVVTAEKRTESVQTIPVSITVVPGDELVREGVSNLADLSTLSSGIEFTSITAGTPGTAAFIRGIGTETVGGSTTTGSVAMVLDGVTMGNTAVSTIFDVNHVELLKGPQGTLFGGSVSAGVINIVTNAPDLKATSAEVDLEYGSGTLGSQYERSSIHAVANLPISDNSALRIAFHADDNSGVFHDVWTGASSSEPNNGARIRYLWQPNENFTLNFTYDYSNATHDNYPSLTYRSAPANPPYNQLATALAACGVTPGTSNYDFCSQYDDLFTQLDRGAALQLDWKLGENTLTSITAERQRQNTDRSDIEAIPESIMQSAFALGTNCQFFNCVPIYAILPGGTNGVQSQNRQQISEELRLSSPSNKHLEWIAGLYYQRYKLFDNEPGLITDNFGGGTSTSPTNWWANVTTSEAAAFGNATYYFTDASRVVAGARYTHASVDESQYYPGNFGNNNVYSLDTGASEFTWRLGFQQDLAEHAMLYLMASTGFKAQEIHDQYLLTLPSGAVQLGNEVKPELPVNYELGIKQSFFGNRLAVDADVFYEHVRDYQGQNCNANNTGTVTCEAANIPYINSKGVELDIFGHPIHSLTLNLSGTYDSAVYPGGYNGSDGVSLAGDQVEYASKVKITASAEESLPINSDYNFVVGLDYTYRSDQRLYTQAAPWFVAPASSLYNARIGIASNKKWSAYIFGRNLGATAFPRQIYPTPFQSGPQGQPGGLWEVLDANAKRLVGLQVQAKF